MLYVARLLQNSLIINYLNDSLKGDNHVCFVCLVQGYQTHLSPGAKEIACQYLEISLN